MLIDVREPVEMGTATHTPYERIRGRLLGEIDPMAAVNAVIQDVDAAPRNANGRVDYVSTFTLLRPTDAEADSGMLIVALPNRGGRGVASGTGANGVDPFYFEQGYAVLWVGWQGDLPERPSASVSAASLKLESIRVPRAAGGERPLTGPYVIRVPTGGERGPEGPTMRLDQGRAGPLIYPPASFDTPRSTLTGGPAEDSLGQPSGPRYTVPAEDWVWWDCAADARPTPDSLPASLCVKRLKGTFNPSESYTLVFEVRDPLIMGLGLAAIRDATSFFRYAGSDRGGVPNPMAGRVRAVVGQGVSQVGNLVKTLIRLGFNTDEQGRRVWDGAHAHIGGRITPLNFRFSTPGSSPTLYMPGSEGILWWGQATDARRGGAPGSLLDRCERDRTCPKVIETFGGAELWNQRMTPGLVNLDLNADIPLPPNVRRYYFPGTRHGGGEGGFGLKTDPGACVLPANPNPETDQVRALTLALVRWVVEGKEPPPSAFPTIQQGDLVRAEPGEYRFTGLPGVPQPFGLANPVLVYDFGGRFNYADLSGVITKQPPPIIGRVPAMVAQVGSDGNEISGVPSVQHRAALGTYLSWNVYRGGPYAGQICSFNGGFVPFKRTKDERLAAGDPRLSIAERYGSRAGYVAAVRAAVDEAKQQGFLLPRDGERLVREAEEATRTGDLQFLTP